MKYDIIEITRDNYPRWVYDPNGLYYCSVPGMPEYVPYAELRQALYRNLGIMLPRLNELTFRNAGNKAYAYVRLNAA